MSFYVILFINIIVLLLGVFDTSDYIFLYLYPNDSVAYQSYQWITYQFVHYDTYHFLVNIFSLVLFGLFVQNSLKNYFGLLYVLSGLFGAYFQFYFNPHGILVGSSASVFGIMAYYALISNGLLRIIFILLFALEIMNITKMDNIAHIAHIGGALMGFMYFGTEQILKLLYKNK